MDEKINATSLIYTLEDKKRTSVVDVFNVAELTETLKALQGERDEKYEEIHRSWIDTAVDEILKENKYSSYDFIHIPVSDTDPFISSIAIGDWIVGIKSSTYVLFGMNDSAIMPYTTIDSPDVNSNIFMTQATCVAKNNNDDLIVLSSNGQLMKIKMKEFIAGAENSKTLEEIINEHGYLQKIFTCPTEPFTDVVFIADRFVAVTGNGKIYKSIDDGDTWSLVEEYQGKQFTSIASSGNALFAITNDGNSYLSVNYGDDWVNHTMPYPIQYSDIAYSEEIDTFIACAIDGDYRIAKWDNDNAVWNSLKSPTQHEWKSITSGNGVIAMVGNGVASASYDGEKWYNILIPNHDWTTMCRADNFFYVFSADGYIARSSNGGITGLLFSTEEETLKGIETGKPVSPFTLHKFIDSLIATTDEAIDGIHQRKIITPFTMHKFIDSCLPWDIDKGGTGADTVEQAKINFSLENVDNTRDIDKPISTATQNALNDKLDKIGGTITGDLNIEGILSNVGLQTALDSKQPIGDYATNEALNQGLDSKQPIGDYATNEALNQGLDSKYDKTGGLIKGRVDISPSTSPTQTITLSMFATDDEHYRNDYFYNGMHIGGLPIRYMPEEDGTIIYMQAYKPASDDNTDKRIFYIALNNRPEGNNCSVYNGNFSCTGKVVNSDTFIRSIGDRLKELGYI